MKVILLQDVARLGRRFDVADVPSGHALNYLIPRKLAEAATADSLKRVEALRQKQEKDTEALQGQFAEALEKLKTAKVQLVAEANEQGHLFRSIKVEEISDALRGENIMILPSQIVLETPIKSVGEHEVTLSSGEKEGSFRLTVVAK